MCNEDFYAEFANEVLTLNGLDYSVNNHSPGARYMATGKLDSLAYPTFAALVAAGATSLALKLPKPVVAQQRVDAAVPIDPAILKKHLENMREEMMLP